LRGGSIARALPGGSPTDAAAAASGAPTGTDVHQFLVLIIAVVSAFAMATQLPPDDRES